MSENQTADTAGRKRAEAANFLPIVRGRLPLLFVHAVRFDETLAAMSTKDVAAKFATSVGKVFDIRKNRNFGYVDANWKPTAEDIAAANGWIEQIGGTNAKGLQTQGDRTLMERIVDQYQMRGLASSDEAAAFVAARAATRTRKPAGEKTTEGASQAQPTGGDAAAALLG